MGILTLLTARNNLTRNGYKNYSFLIICYFPPMFDIFFLPWKTFKARPYQPNNFNHQFFLLKPRLFSLSIMFFQRFQSIIQLFVKFSFSTMKKKLIWTNKKFVSLFNREKSTNNCRIILKNVRNIIDGLKKLPSFPL